MYFALTGGKFVKNRPTVTGEKKKKKLLDNIQFSNLLHTYWPNKVDLFKSSAAGSNGSSK